MLTNNGGEDILVRNQYRESLRVLRSQQRNFSAWIVNEESNFTLVCTYRILTTKHV